jgi:hypothetical protein
LLTGLLTPVITIGTVFVALLCRPRGEGIVDDDDVHRPPHQLAGHRVEAIHAAVGVEKLVLDDSSLLPAEIAHSLLELDMEVGGAVSRSDREPANATDRGDTLSAAGRLATRRQTPPARRAARRVINWIDSQREEVCQSYACSADALGLPASKKLIDVAASV